MNSIFTPPHALYILLQLLQVDAVMTARYTYQIAVRHVRERAQGFAGGILGDPVAGGLGGALGESGVLQVDESILAVPDCKQGRRAECCNNE